MQMLLKTQKCMWSRIGSSSTSLKIDVQFSHKSE